MDEQILKDFVTTAIAANYDYDKVLSVFPELSGYDRQILKDYVTTSIEANYDYAKVNSVFPEFFGETQPVEAAQSEGEKKNDTMESPSEDGGSVSSGFEAQLEGLSPREQAKQQAKLRKQKLQEESAEFNADFMRAQQVEDEAAEFTLPQLDISQQDQEIFETFSEGQRVKEEKERREAFAESYMSDAEDFPEELSDAQKQELTSYYGLVDFDAVEALKQRRKEAEQYSAEMGEDVTSPGTVRPPQSIYEANYRHPVKDATGDRIPMPAFEGSETLDLTEVSRTGIEDIAEYVAKAKEKGLTEEEAYKQYQYLDRLYNRDLEYTKYLNEKGIIPSEEKRIAQEYEEERLASLRGQMEAAERAELLSSEQFNEDLKIITPELIAEDDEGVTADIINRTFGKNGIQMTPNGDIVALNGAKAKFNLDPFTGTVERAEAKRLKKFMMDNATQFGELPEQGSDTDALYAYRAKNLRETPRVTLDNEVEGLKFTTKQVDGKTMVFPTLFPTDPNNYNTNPSTWTEFGNVNDAYETAKARGEVFEFENAEDAEEFAAGGWKNISTLDFEKQLFMKDLGFDYLASKTISDRYYDAYDEIDFLNRDRKQIEFLSNLSDEEKELYGDKYYADGKLRRDYMMEIPKLKQQADLYEDIVLSPEFADATEAFDAKMAPIAKEQAAEASRAGAAADVYIQGVEQTSLANFGVTVAELSKMTPKTEQEAEEMNLIITEYNRAIDAKQLAANKYAMAETYFDSKFDRNFDAKLLENGAAVANAWNQGWNRGQAAETILAISLGITDIDDETSLEEAAELISQNLQEAETGKMGKAQYRFHRARNLYAAYKAFQNDPLELGTALAAESMSQMLPYGWKIVLGTTATGAGIGGAAGAPAGGVGAIPGAIGGGIKGARAGMAATMLAMEYTNSVMDVARERGYDLNNPDDVKDALMDDEVWAEGRRIGLSRGIPIAVVDYLSAGLAGRVFKLGSVASRPARVAALTTERIVFDPAMEAVGETAAQISAGQKISSKDIFAEAIGAFGQKTPAMVANLAMDAKRNSKIAIAKRLETVEGMAQERSSDSRISAWANNMERLGQITAEQNQRIQENVGIRRNARELLSTGRGKTKTSGRQVEQRMMTLLNARDQLSSTTNRKAVFGSKIAEINQEIAELAEGKKVRAEEDQTVIPESVTSLSEGSIEADPREDLQSYKIRGKQVTREQFLAAVEKASTPKRVARLRPEVENDDEVTDILNVKLKDILQDAVQEPSTAEVDVQEQATPSQEVGEGDIQVSETTQEGETQVVPDITVDETVEEDVSPQQTTQEEVTEQEAADIDAFFDEETETTERIEDNLSRNKEGTDTDITPETQPAPRVNSVVEVAKRAARAISKTMPEVRIVLHDTTEEYQKYTNRTGRGIYQPETKTIHINLSKATGSTVAHEVFHAALLGRISTDRQAAAATKTMMRSVAKALPRNSDLRKKIVEFSKNYDENIQNEEALAELIGLIAENYEQNKLTPPAKNAVIQFLQKLGRIFGISTEFTKDDQAVIDMLNAIARKTAEGEVIEETELPTAAPSVARSVEIERRSESLQQRADLLSQIDDIKGRRDALDKQIAEGGLSKEQENSLRDEVDKLTDEISEILDTLEQQKVTSDTKVVSNEEAMVDQEPGTEGLVGKFNIREQIDSTPAPSAKNDPRPWIRSLVTDIDFKEFNGRDFVTNMYDFTAAGQVDFGQFGSVEFVNGVNYVPYMMEKQGLGIGDVSNIAAFNTKAQAEGFIRQVEGSGATLFSPHAGSFDGSWQFQQLIFRSLTDLALDFGILTKKDLIQAWNAGLNNKGAVKAFEDFNKSLIERGLISRPIKNLNRFKGNPKEVVELLSIEEGLDGASDLRKALNQKIASDKKFQSALGIRNLVQFAELIQDPSNTGRSQEGGELMGAVEFDPTNFEVSQPKKGDLDYNESFGWTVKAKVEGIYQPTRYYKSWDVTNQYSTYTADGGVNVVSKSDFSLEKFKKKTVKSSAGAIPKVASFATREQKSMDDIINEGRENNFRDSVIRDYLVRRLKFPAREVDKAMQVAADIFRLLPDSFKNIEGGVEEGAKLFQSILDYQKKLENRNKRSKRMTDQEIKADVSAFAKKMKRTYDSAKDINDKVAKFRKKEESNNKRRKNKLTKKQIDARVAEYKSKLSGS